MLMATSVAFLGNAIRSLQEADVVRLTPLNGWPRAPIFLAQALGYWPSRQTVGGQVALSAVYLVGAAVFVVRGRAARAATTTQAVGAPTA
jgi:high-affinity Fe2+/Pb2+ permease